ncbi:LytTR family DNA-binding domain-containing protein [Chryseobacterium sp.]|uniref:LytR/AlgR family response regulator transcription factor n=1 Tax=Chryseobacterium sp. TaxID=1871047 RepID=UPI0025B7D810|nr:LytTR family DNA-binding domain-containing protein [Chryseobacterium sp.]MBV8327464.1 response regulator transcription factor [Chryseobacterium sp.]
MSEILRCIVIDDEPLGREVIENFVEKIPFITLSSSFGDPLEALDYLQKSEVDIVLTDIQMPKINGLELIQSLPNPPVVIFITAHRDFALDGFDTGAADYLVKPVRFDRFLKAINRAKDFIGNNKKSKKENLTDRIFIKTDGKLVKILLKDILYVEAQGDYLKIATEKNSYTTLSTMKSMDEALTLPAFFRVQRSFIVNVSAVQAINGNMVELVNGKIISIAVSKKDELFTLLGL